MDNRKIQNALHAEKAQAVIGAIVTHGTGWLQLVGVLILLLADVWLGAQVFMSRGMDAFTSYLITISTSAVQIALFANGGELIGKATGKWKKTIGISAISIGWIVAVLDSFLDGSAAFVKLGGGIPTTWSGIWRLLHDPIVMVAFVIFFILSLMGERLARLVIHGEYDEERQPKRSPAATFSRPPSLASQSFDRAKPPSMPLTELTAQDGLEILHEVEAEATQGSRMGLVPEQLPAELQGAPNGWKVIHYDAKPGSFIIRPSVGRSKVWSPGDPVPW